MTERRILSRRAFLGLVGGAVGLGVLAGFGLDRLLNRRPAWAALLGDYTASTRSNIVTVNGRRALLSARLYPGTYVRDALFWGPLALADPALGHECYQWFAETQLASGQIRSAVPLHPEEASALVPQDDEGTLLYVIASDWLHGHGYAVDFASVERAYAWVQTHVIDDLYVSAAGAFRYWADTLYFDTADTISHNQGLLCLARRAMVNLGLGGVSEADVQAAEAGYRAFYDAAEGYLKLGQMSVFAFAQDISTVLPEFISRYLYDAPILDDEVVVAHVDHIVHTAAVADDTGRLAGLKVISAPTGLFLLQEWFSPAELNEPGYYQNGGYWPMYALVALALAYAITRDVSYAALIERLVISELGEDHTSKEVIRLAPGAVGTFDPARTHYTWNALIRTACEWAGLV
ncbi:MAG: hypothetical protein JW910_09095 [Anaerolineae bacterium]|nr:hypothetical protein [Anaerolineae bacterium]